MTTDLPRPDDERFWPRRAFTAPPPPYGDYATARVVILPVPYDSTVTARAGAKTFWIALETACATSSATAFSTSPGCGAPPFSTACASASA